MNELNDYEKMIEGINKFALLISEYYKALLDNGFKKEEALTLTVAYQNSIVKNSISPKNDND